MNYDIIIDEVPDRSLSVESYKSFSVWQTVCEHCLCGRGGDVMVSQNGAYGLINPSCYVYPKENNCSPGNGFTDSQKM